MQKATLWAGFRRYRVMFRVLLCRMRPCCRSRKQKRLGSEVSGFDLQQSGRGQAVPLPFGSYAPPKAVTLTDSPRVLTLACQETSPCRQRRQHSFSRGRKHCKKKASTADPRGLFVKRQKQGRGLPSLTEPAFQRSRQPRPGQAVVHQ